MLMETAQYVHNFLFVVIINYAVVWNIMFTPNKYMSKLCLFKIYMNYEEHDILIIVYQNIV